MRKTYEERVKEELVRVGKAFGVNEWQAVGDRVFTGESETTPGVFVRCSTYHSKLDFIGIGREEEATTTVDISNRPHGCNSLHLPKKTSVPDEYAIMAAGLKVLGVKVLSVYGFMDTPFGKMPATAHISMFEKE